MDLERKKILKDALRDTFSIKDKFFDFEVNSKFQLLISQLDLFKVLASLVIGIIGIGYFFNSKLDIIFLLVSLTFALITLILSISYTRETIDQQEKQSKETHLLIDEEVEEHINVTIDAFKKDNFEIFSDYAKNKLEKKYPNPPLNWAGEIIIFCFYLSLGFLVVAFFLPRGPSELILLPGFKLFIACCVLFFVCVISFKDWAFWMVQKLSIFLNYFSSGGSKS